MRTIIKKQMMFWFGIPVIVALIAAVSILTAFYKGYSGQMIAYVGKASIAFNTIFILSSIVVILGCYFITTWILFNKNIECD